MGAANSSARFESSPSKHLTSSDGSSNTSNIKKIPQIDTNFFELNLNCLKIIPLISNLIPLSCESCGSFLNHTTRIEATGDNMGWVCTFCDQFNIIKLPPPELPLHSEQNFLLEDIKTDNPSPTPQNQFDCSSIIFCMDISGSMSLKKKVQNNDSTFSMISRLLCMKTAVDNQITDLRSNFPNKRVGLVSFNNEVTIIGDGVATETIPQEALGNFDQLMDFSQDRRGKFLNTPISESYSNLKSSIMNLKSKGGTALGPALLVSIILASESGPGSQVVICTDGLANIGVGDLSSQNSLNEFYKEAGSISKELGVSVSVITIQGQDCCLEALNLVTFETQGEIVKVDLESLSSQFSAIISQELVATQVQVEIYLHKSIQFHNEKPKNLSNGNSTLKKFIGNANNSTSFSFRYAIKTDDELERLEVNKKQLTQIPVQVTFRFKGPDGRKYLKVITRVQKVEFDTEIKADELDGEVLARAARRNIIQLIEDGNLQDAMSAIDSWMEMARERKNEEFLQDLIVLKNNIESHLAGNSGKGLTDEFVAVNHALKKKR